jgi:gluconolactonase
LSVLSLILLTSLVTAEEPPNFAATPPPVSLLAPEAKVSTVARTSFLEGPAVDAAGTLFFSDMVGNRIYQLSPEGALSVFRADSGRSNGNTFDAEGRLVTCEGAEQGPGGRRRVVRTDMKTQQTTVLTDRYQGKRYNSPNDVCVDAAGRIYFTDPYYGDDRSALEMDADAVYRIDPDGTVTRILSQPQIERPNGIAVSPDAKTLYLIDSHPRPGGNRKIWAFDLSASGVPSNQRLVFDFGKGRGGDGFRLDRRGNLWVAAGILIPRTAGETTDVPSGVYVISPQGKLLGRIPIPEDVITNVAFGGSDRRTLYVTAGKSIFKIPLAVEGYALYPPASPEHP